MGEEPYEKFWTPGSSGGSGQPTLEVGMMGFSIEDISQGKQGWVRLPLGVRDSTKWGGRKWERIKVTALEAVRANRDIIVANEQGEVKEHTPVELSYQTLAGPYQRVTTAFPLPVTMGSKALSWVNIEKTDSSTTTIKAPASGKKLRIHYVIISSAHGAVAEVGLTFKASPTVADDYVIRVFIPADGGTVSLNLTDANIEGSANATLYAWANAAYANGVFFNVAWEEV